LVGDDGPELKPVAEEDRDLMWSGDTILALLSLAVGTVAVRAILPLWYRRAVNAQMRRHVEVGARPPPLPGAPGPEAASVEVELQEVAPGAPQGSNGEADALLVRVRGARRRRLVLRAAALVLAPALQALLLLAHLEPATPGASNVTPRALLVAAIVAGVVPVLLALRSLVSYSQLSTVGSWWLLAVPVGAGLGADAWVTWSALGAVRPLVNLAAFAIVAAACYAVLLLLLAGSRLLRRLFDLSSDGFSFLLVGAVGSLVVGVVLAGADASLGWLLTLAPLPIYAAAVLVPRRLAGPEDRPRSLLFLRTFRGPRSLLPGLSRYWLHMGEVHLLVGPDIATRTASADGVLSLVTGRLRHHFVSGPADVDRKLTGSRSRPARDGRFDVLEFPCLSAAWQSTLARLASGADAILLDLRGFQAANAGCVFELETLAALGVVSRTLIVADSDTDRAAARAALARGFGSSPGRSGTAAVAVWRTAPGQELEPGAIFSGLGAVMERRGHVP
jgi:hypothetical protein